MAKTLGLGIIGCGDYLRWQVPDLKGSSVAGVRALFDTQSGRAASYAAKVGGSVVGSAEEVIGRADVDIVLLFVPPWVRHDLLLQCVAHGKHVLTTKPLAPTVAQCAAMVEAVEGTIRCGVMYGRAGNAGAETYKRLFTGGEIGKLALYHQCWIHHYPQWNTWATDPDKNGGPFMDAMIHNLNTARYLMGRPVTRASFFSDNHAQDLKCSDTESMKVDFADNGSAHLFITWAADLAVESTEGNYREHIDNKFMVTDKGWYVTERKGEIVASRDGKEKVFAMKGPGAGVFDRFATAMRDDTSLPGDISSIREAYEDIKLIRDAEAAGGQCVEVDLTVPEPSAVA
jgi:predicted dehydrogenase